MDNQVMYIAHRGVSKNIKDNSVEAINLAIMSTEYDGVEIDVQLCKSGEIVLYHDINLHGHFIKDLNYDELKLYDIISLEDLYKKVPFIQEKILLIDIKGNDYNIVPTLEGFFKFMDTSNIYFCSFNAPLVKQLDRRFNKGRTFECFFHPNEYEMIMHGFDMVMVHWTCLNAVLIDFCKTRDIAVFTYTHKDPIELKHMLSYNVDGVITNGV